MITERILAQMQKGIIPWNRPWAGPKVTGENAAIGYNSRRAQDSGTSERLAITIRICYCVIRNMK